MREALHQLSLALALPIAVTVVWVVRGDPAGVVAPQTATAYRAELAALPLPGAVRLRAPREPREWQGERRALEDPVARRRRAALPEVPALPPFALATPAGSAGERLAVAAPRAEQPELASATGPSALLPPLAHAEASTPSLVAARSASAAALKDLRVEAAPIPVKPSAQAPVKPVAAARSISGVSAAPTAGEPAAKPAPALHESAAKLTPVVRETAAKLAPLARDRVAKSAPVVVAARNTATPVRDDAPVETPPSRGGPEKGWRDGVAAAPRSPALAHATRETQTPLDLTLAGRRQAREPVALLLPTPAAPVQPFAPVAAADPTASAATRFALELPLRLPDLPLPAPDVMAWSSNDDVTAEVPASFPNSRFLPGLFTLLAIPEPGSAALLGVALATLAMVRRRRKRG